MAWLSADGDTPSSAAAEVNPGAANVLGREPIRPISFGRNLRGVSTLSDPMNVEPKREDAVRRPEKVNNSLEIP